MAEEQPGYSERDNEPTTEQTGGDPDELRREEAERERERDEKDEPPEAPAD